MDLKKCHCTLQEEKDGLQKCKDMIGCEGQS